MDGVGSQKFVEIARLNAVYLMCDLSKRFDKAALGVFGQQHTFDRARWIIERCFDGMLAVKADDAVASAVVRF